MKQSNKKGSEWVFGIHSVQALLKTSSERVQRLYLLQSRKDQRLTKLIALAEKQEVSFEFLPREELDKLIENSGGSDFDDQDINHQGAIAQCSPGKVHDEAFLNELLDGLTEDPLLLVLDGVTDPHNLGACLRTAEAAGVQAVIAPKDNSASVNPTVRKVASGAAETLPYIVVTNLSRTLKALQRRGVWIVGSAGEAEQSIYQTDFTGPKAIVMGAEGEGMRRLTREHCDFLASIPMQGHVGSLNVSVAVGVFLFESLRQRGK
ncbi:MAG: 23S rRNA (guanosine(2251)-2'-O)-methyltransferase RlmB [Cellvibrionaceae bacterium]